MPLTRFVAGSLDEVHMTSLLAGRAGQRPYDRTPTRASRGVNAADTGPQQHDLHWKVEPTRPVGQAMVSTYRQTSHA